MASSKGVVRQSVSLPSDVAEHVQLLAKGRRQSANRILVSLIEAGLHAQQRRQQEFFELAERFRSCTDEAEVKLLGEQMGRMVFGD